MSDRLCVVMPVYNEQEAIGPVLEKWDAALKALGIDYEIRPYNDGSKDNSLTEMRKVASKLRSCINVRDKPNGGHGNTILTGYREAAADGFDWIFQIDSDDEMGPEKFDELWSRRNNHDFLVGIRDGRRQALPRKIVSLVSRFCVRLFYGKSVWDVNTPYRLMRVSAFKAFYAQIPLATFAPNVILSGLAARHKLRCFETRVPQHDRTTGEVSIKKWKLLKAAAKSFWQTIAFACQMYRRQHAKLLLQAVFGLVILLFGLSVFVFSMNPITDTAGLDSAVFAYIGDGMRNGLLPYRDMFDHKGPLLYLINWLGMSMGIGYAGVWIIDIIMYLLSFCFAGLILSRIVGRKGILLAMVVALWLFIHLFGGGNMTESYATYFALVAWSLFAQDIYRDNLRLLSCFVQGVAVGSVLLLRPNMIGFAVPVVVYCVYDLVRSKDWKKFIIRGTIGFTGIIAVVLPICVWLLMSGIMKDCWNCYIQFNLLYVVKNRYVITREILFPIIAIVINIWLIIGSDGKKQKLLTTNLVYLLSAFVIVAAKLTYDHYYLPILPATIIPLAYLYNDNHGRLIAAVKMVILLILTVLLIYWPVTRFINVRKLVTSILNLQKPIIERRIMPDEEVYRQLREVIGEHETVCTMGNPAIYYQIKRKSNSKYFYTFITCWDSSKEEPICKNIESGIDDYILLYDAKDHKYSNEQKRTTPVYEYIKRYYVHCATIGNYTVMKYNRNIECDQQESGIGSEIK